MSVKSLVRRSATPLMEKVAGAAFGPMVAFWDESSRTGLIEGLIAPSTIVHGSLGQRGCHASLVQTLIYWSLC